MKNAVLLQVFYNILDLETLISSEGLSLLISPNISFYLAKMLFYINMSVLGLIQQMAVKVH